MQQFKAVRQALAAKQLDALLLPRSDAYLNEDLAPADERLRWLTGFTGSQGLAVLTRHRAALLVDGRYHEQAEQECGGVLEVLGDGDDALFAWLASAFPHGGVIGCDATLHSAAELARWQARARALRLELHALASNPLDACWLQRPSAPASPVVPQSLAWAGQGAADKLAQLTGRLRASGCCALWLPAPDMLAWLLNVRGQDIAIAPLPFSSGLLHCDGTLDWFIDEQRLQLPWDWLPPSVAIHPPEAAQQLWRLLAARECRKIWVDPALSTAASVKQLREAGCELHEAAHPLPLLRACKQPAELAGCREAHRLDGLALCRFLYQFDQQRASFLGQSELFVAAELEGHRQRSADYRGASFDTIAATGANGAMPHYLPKPGEAARLSRGQLLLIDSGGQYPQGTTDVTRVLPCGTPTARQRFLYTLVLRAHIALASSRFPRGTGGMTLDTIARQVMWREGLDYDHGTGHGVGSYLQVHEGPQRIARHASATPLQPGMVTSIEPGVYLPGELGIRIENLYEVVACAERPGYLEFRVLTLAPLEPTLIDRKALNAAELAWLQAYHVQVYQRLAADLEPEVASWLARQTGAAQSSAQR
ncbi:aminopeptidase P family protein [Pseudomonas cavernae]|uniref:Aminopeptidase P family protein n=1 Tax=Pseudomonas cavernae TaxID=2320867 RepID=A0A385Z462_9PSED|nr:aminopeptidase P family protein [Pseudomonas cavernae]AYC32292.1 aminopeptidase P family protein [Pseudomonas cavernae]